jgi:hypothetical protein
MGDLILNAIALAFVLDCDELVFQMFVPQRTWALQARLEPIPVPMQPLTAKLGSWFIPLARALLVSGVLVLVYFLVLTPFHWRLQQANYILCSGDLDFVYAESSATGLVHVARSKDFETSSEDWTYVEQVVLQVASDARGRVNLSSGHGWEVPTKLKDSLSSMGGEGFVVPAQIEIGAESMSLAVFSTAAFGEIVEMQSWTTEVAAESLPCADLGVQQSASAALGRLRLIAGDPNISDCSDVPWQYCSQLNMTQLRALCPARCSCHRAPGDGALTGFFGHPKYGCPAQCASLVGAYSEQEYLALTGEYSNYSAVCADLQPDLWIYSDSCANTEGDTGDKYGEYCDEDRYDTATTVACTSGYYDDDDFSAQDMCCGCGGGDPGGAKSSMQCVDNLTAGCENMERAAFFWVLYVRGLFDYMLARTGFEEMLESNMLEPALNIPVGLHKDFVQYIMNGSMMQSFVDQSWEFMAGFDHPRNLTGCEYLTSWEFRMLLSIDLCSPDSFTSIQRLCPASCGCSPGSPPSQCPQECL